MCNRRATRSSIIRQRIAIFATAIFWLALVDTSLAQDFGTVDNGLPDFTQMNLEDLVKQDVKVRERLEGTRKLTLQEGILGGHVHSAGEWMIGYNYSYMYMDGNRIGTNRISTSDVFADGFMVSPTRMTMDMHMVHLMHAPSERFTWMAMAPFKQLTMDHTTAMGGQFTTQTGGIGDVSLSGFFTFLDTERKVYSGRIESGPNTKSSTKKNGEWCRNWDELRQAYLALAMYFPTGSIDEHGATPMNPNAKLPYPMQLGSGTFDLEPGITFQSLTENWAWGLRAGYLARLGRNKYDYALGDRFSGSFWASRKINQRWAFDMRLDSTLWGNIRGADPELNPAIVPTARPDLIGGNRLDYVIGLSFYVPEGALTGNRIHAEIGVPLYQSLNGPQLETDWLLKTGWSWTY